MDFNEIGSSAGRLLGSLLAIATFPFAFAFAFGLLSRTAAYVAVVFVFIMFTYGDMASGNLGFGKFLVLAVIYTGVTIMADKITMIIKEKLAGKTKKVPENVDIELVKANADLLERGHIALELLLEQQIKVVVPLLELMVQKNRK